MAWQEVALEIAKEIAKNVAAAVIDSFTPNELEDALNDAIQKIEIITREALLESTKNELRANILTLRRVLEEYRNTPTDTMKLDFAYQVASYLVYRLMLLNLVNPPGTGLAGHPEFLIAASLKMAVLQERIKCFPQFAAGERKNLSNFIKESIGHVEMLHVEWGAWNSKRFSDLFPIYAYSTNTIDLWYTFNGEWIHAGQTSVSAGAQQAIERAETVRQDHINREYDKLYKEFVEPSKKVVEEWRRLLSRQALERLKRLTKIYSDMEMGRRWRAPIDRPR